MSKFYAQLLAAESAGHIPTQTSESVRRRGSSKLLQYKDRMTTIADFTEQFADALAFAKAVVGAEDDSDGFDAEEQAKMDEFTRKSTQMLQCGSALTEAIEAYMNFCIADKELAMTATDRILAAMKEVGRE